MTLKDIAEIIAEKKGKQFTIPVRKLYEDLVVIHTARVLTNILEKKPNMKKLYSNSIILELEEVDKDECALLGCACENVLRTTEKVPNPLKIGTSGFDFVGAPGGVTSYGWSTFPAEAFYQYNKYTKDLVRYTLLNDHIYLFNDKNSEKIRVEDVFADKRKLAKFSCSALEEIPCYSETSDYIADVAITQLVIQSIVEKEFRILEAAEEIEVKTDKNV